MKFANAVSILGDMRFALGVALIPTIRAILRSPSLLIRPAEVSRLFFSHVWAPFGNGLDEHLQEIKTTLITPNAHGIVLDIGAGTGHTAKYLDKTLVSQLVALEPNTYMHPALRSTAEAAGFTEASGTLLILPYGAEQTALITSALGGTNTVDTFVTVHSLCSVPDGQAAIQALVERALKPGGSFLFYEHVRNEREDVAWWQRFWTPVWTWVFDGCCLGRPTDRWIEGMGPAVWAEVDVRSPEDDVEETLFPRRYGKFTKVALA